MEYFKSERFRARVEHLLEKRHVLGAAVALVHDQTVASDGFGLARLNPPVPCTPDTLFDIASSSKSLTAGALAVMINTHLEHIKWDTPVQALLGEDWVLSQQEHTVGTTLEDIVSHRSGIPPHDLSCFGQPAKKPDTALSVTRNLRNFPAGTLFPPRTKYMYNNNLYTAITHIIEKKKGCTFPEYLEETFFEPLGMTSSSVQPSAAISKGLGDRIARGYVWRRDLNKLVEIEAPDCPEAQGAGSVVTCVNDHIKWVKALIHREGPVTEQVYRDMIRQLMIRFPDYEYTLPFMSTLVGCSGLNSVYYRGQLLVGHAGEIDGFGTYHFFLPEHKFGGSIFTNGTYGRHLGYTLAYEIIDELLDVPQGQRIDWDEAVHKAEDTDGEDHDPFDEVLQKKLYPDAKDIKPLPPKEMAKYLGIYYNAAYGDLQVEIRNGKLFIDASDRSMGFTVTLAHVYGGINFVSEFRICERLGGAQVGVARASFGLANQIGPPEHLYLRLEPELEMDICFERK